MSTRLILAPLLVLAVSAGAWALRPSDTSEAPAGVPGAAGDAARTRLVTNRGSAEDDGTTPDAQARADALQASRDAVFEAVHYLLDALDAEVGLDDAQYDRLETVLTDERTRGFAALDAVRRGPAPGQPRPDDASIAATMAASRAQAEAEARAVLDDEEYAAWQRLREPARRR